jgi:hypothetical protein
MKFSLYFLLQMASNKFNLNSFRFGDEIRERIDFPIVRSLCDINKINS